MIDIGYATHVGLRREHNEDCFAVERDLGLFLVADGMGGHEAGEVASALARDVIVEQVRAKMALTEALGEAHQAIMRHPQGGHFGSKRGMGTTAVVVRMQGPDFEAAWVGDSRIYLLDARKKLLQVSRDHTPVQDLVDAGRVTAEQARKHPMRNILSQALGMADNDLLVDLVDGRLAAGESLLLCSDGLSEDVEDKEIARILAGPGKAQAKIDALIAAALAGGGSDNITAVLVERLG